LFPSLDKEAAERQEIVQWTILAKERAGAQAVFALVKKGEFDKKHLLLVHVQTKNTY
jgi:hypothetical protein